MQQRQFKPFDSVSALTLGGGGLGQVWGETSREEAVATVNLAIEKGITHLDVAPMYGKGDQIRDWIYVDDHVAAIKKILFSKFRNETFITRLH